MDNNVYLRLARAIGVILAIGIFLALWQIWGTLGIAFLIYVYVKDRGKRFPKVYFALTNPTKFITGTKK